MKAFRPVIRLQPIEAVRKVRNGGGDGALVAHVSLRKCNAMATQPEVPPPDIIEPLFPPDSPPIETPSETPFEEPPEVDPTAPDHDRPDREIPEVTPPPD